MQYTRFDLVFLAGIVAATTTATFAHADERAECAHAYEQAQRLQQSGEMGKALAAAERCAQPSCPALLADECKPWMMKIREQLATVQVRASGFDGCPLRDATVEIDRVKHLPFTDLLVDPGIHEVRVVDTATTRVVDKTINVAHGERREVDLGFADTGVVCGAATRPEAPPATSTTPKVAIGLGIAGGGLLLTGVVLGIIGASKRSDLDDCKPSCSSDRIDATRVFFVAGDVIGGVGILALGTAAAVYFLGRGDAGVRATSIRVIPKGIEVVF
jgi:hypothetical protein